MGIFRAGVAGCVALVMAGCAQTSVERNATEQERMNWYRPAVVLTYELPNDARTNNAPAIVEAVRREVSGDVLSRQVVVVARVGNGGGDVAMERARRAAMLLMERGEQDPRLYVRQVRIGESNERDQGVVEIYVFPKPVWSDAAFVTAMKTESLEVEALGGVLRSDLARASMNEVFERSLITRKGDLHSQMAYVLGMVGWQVRVSDIPSVTGPSKEFVLSLPVSGVASPDEVIALVGQVAKVAGVVQLDIAADSKRRIVDVSKGFALVGTDEE